LDWILENAALLAMVVAAANGAQVPPELVLAIIEAESGGNPYAAKITPTYPYTVPQAKRPAGVDPNTELYMQKTAWGLMQVMGATARSVGFDGRLPELTDPNVNVRLGVAYLETLMRKHQSKHGLAGVIAAYNGGAPRKRPDGKFINQGYVDRVTKAMEKYRGVAEQKKDAATGSEETAEPDGEKSDPAANGKGKKTKN
jgi:soluble lytic murein transglycosylase-like protein